MLISTILRSFFASRGTPGSTGPRRPHLTRTRRLMGTVAVYGLFSLGTPHHLAILGYACTRRSTRSWASRVFFLGGFLGLPFASTYYLTLRTPCAPTNSPRRPPPRHPPRLHPLSASLYLAPSLTEPDLGYATGEGNSTIIFFALSFCAPALPCPETALSLQVHQYTPPSPLKLP